MSLKALKIAPSILAADFGRLAEQVVEAQAAGADLIHIDIMDGRFVPNITMGPLVVEAVAKVASIPLDVHLMIVEPEQYVQRFADSGADTISVHVEACPHLHRALGRIADAGCGAGVALNPHTPPTAVSEVADMLRLINVMTVNPGFGGQQFIHGTLAKIRRLRSLVDARDAAISTLKLTAASPALPSARPLQQGLQWRSPAAASFSMRSALPLASRNCAGQRMVDAERTRWRRQALTDRC